MARNKHNATDDQGTTKFEFFLIVLETLQFHTRVDQLRLMLIRQRSLSNRDFR